jgi:hypothetical protein
LIVSVGDRTAQLKAEKLRSGHAEEALRIALSVLRETLADKDD